MRIDFAFRLQALRDELTASGHSGFFVPMADEYQNEYVPASAQRIAFLTGFTGSAGFLIVLRDKAAFFTDGRYTLQASEEVPSDLFLLFDSTKTTPSKWLKENAKSGMLLAYDPWLHTADGIDHLKKALASTGAELVAVDKNPIDAIWPDRPAAPAALVYAYDMAYAGKSSADKRAFIAADLTKQNLAAAILSDPASVAWLLNVRGGDVPNTPLPLSFAIIHDTAKVKWFVDPRKVPKGLEQHLGQGVDIEHPEQFLHALESLGRMEKPIRIDGAGAAMWIVDHLRAAGAKLEFGEDPCLLPKACKNAIELEGMRACHRRDGAALVNFLAWLDHQMAVETITELRAAHELAEFRGAANLYRGPSFDTISAAGAHAAIVHYRATPTSNGTLKEGRLYLIDSGSQYFDGTTDVTRTIAVGDTSGEMRDRFTRVLKGHIALSAVRFPDGTTGAELDALARQHLWAIGLDYNHGTGHGVGTFLGVHEGPQGISKRNKVPLKPGMVVSNEPGFYKNGAFGIRIENLQAVIEVVELSGGDRKMFGFETLTLAPIDRRLIEKNMLTPDELQWLNTYHTRVRDVIRPMVDGLTADWLAMAAAPI